MKTKAPSTFARYLETRVNILNEVINGLRGNPFQWGDGERSAKNPILKELGVTLVTKSFAEKLKYRIKPRSKPVGNVYLGAPLQRYADVYVLECQFEPIEEK